MPVLTRDVYIPIKKFSEIYAVSNSKVRNLIKEGMPHKRIGAGTIRINLTQAEKWLEQFQE